MQVNSSPLTPADTGERIFRTRKSSTDGAYCSVQPGLIDPSKKPKGIFQRFAERRAQEKKPQPTLRRSSGSSFILKPLCTLYAPAYVKIKDSTFLTYNRGDKITLYEIDNSEHDKLFASNGTNKGMISKNLLDMHTPNVYLEALDVLLIHPSLLVRVVEAQPLELPNQLATFVALLTARKILPHTLKILFDVELQENPANQSPRVPFRLETPAVVLTGAVLNAPGKMADFRKNFVQFCRSTINATNSQKQMEEDSTCIILGQCLQHLAKLPNAAFPRELIVVMQSLKEVAESNPQSVPVSVLVGSIFFLRYLLPGLVQPREVRRNSDTIDFETSKSLMNLAKALQLVSNRTDITEDHPFYPIRERLETLYDPTRDLLLRIASIPVSAEKFTTSLIAEAASFYWLIMDIGRKNIDDPALQETLNQLEKKLGQAPLGPIRKETEAPLIDEITRISKIFGALTI